MSKENTEPRTFEAIREWLINHPVLEGRCAKGWHEDIICFNFDHASAEVCLQRCGDLDFDGAGREGGDWLRIPAEALAVMGQAAEELSVRWKLDEDDRLLKLREAYKPKSSFTSVILNVFRADKQWLTCEKEENWNQISEHESAGNVILHTGGEYGDVIITIKQVAVPVDRPMHAPSRYEVNYSMTGINVSPVPWISYDEDAYIDALHLFFNKSNVWT